MRSCPHCGCSEIDEDAARGDATCMGCGTVLEESIVVTENQFQERAGGSGHTLVGQFVSAERAASNNFNCMGTQESREVTYAKGRKVIEEVASQLRINQHCMDTAFNFFKMCVGRNLTRGRTRSSVVAVCLYITCRLENTAHLLLDFSDITQINVFDLGRTLNYISRALRINLPATDPCLYIIRFACMLDLGDKQKDVVNLATRLVQRMKRDWMSTGRRPTGICGAALLMAARSLNFNRSVNDIVRIVHISESVIRKRLDEFSKTPSGNLTIDEFSTIDLEHSEDPPAFREARRRAREDQLRKEAEQADNLEKDIIDVEAEVEVALEKKRKEKFKSGIYAKLIGGNLEGMEQEKDAQDMVRKEILNTVYTAAEEPCSSSQSDNPMERYQDYGPSLVSLGIRQSQSTSEQQNKAKATAVIDEEISDSEIDSYILTEKEVAIKTDYWMKANGEVMKAIEERRREREQNGGEVKKKRRVVKRNDTTAGCTSALDAMEKVIHEKKLSNKINYDMLKDLEAIAPTVSSTASFTAPLSVQDRKVRTNVVPKSDVVIEKTETQSESLARIRNELVDESNLTKSERVTSRKNLKSSQKVGSTIEQLRTVFELNTAESSSPSSTLEQDMPTPKKTESPVKMANVPKTETPTDQKSIASIPAAKSRYAKLKPNLKKPTVKESTEPDAKRAKT
ncbi:unnamed protein product [Caenorhabditis angaria]|uniref:B-related factor 1 n=1 Tax=Caenorhabditis angaria TaxID=860376 RepID=A0A9P1ICX9_9PELO|nr:unnamed protein product [Caenorhabditis angaria]